LACFRDNLGSSISFHCIDGKGYSTNVDKAHVYTLSEAQKEWDTAREYDQPISADHIDSLAVWKVDHQLIPNKPLITADVEEYAAFVEGKWDGNDVYWLNIETADTSTDFLKASVLSRANVLGLSRSYIVIPYSLADQVKRRTFSKEDYKPRVMVQGAGLKMPDHIKRDRRKKINPKSRFNCPSCGKINWQFNPYEFDSCSTCGHIGDLT